MEIFARDGYAGTNIKDIAETVGIVKSALYKHFESKEAIWDAVMDWIAAYYEMQVAILDKLENTPQTTDELLEFTRNMLYFTIHDKRVVQARKVITTEQFRDIKTRDYANKYFLDSNGKIGSICEDVYSRVWDEVMTMDNKEIHFGDIDSGKGARNLYDYRNRKINTKTVGRKRCRKFI